MSELRWQPLEANPDVMNKYAREIGLSTKYEFTDVLSMDLLDFIPRPCYAFIFLFPDGGNHLEACAKLKSKNKDEEQNQSVYFMKQTIRNACGTMALIHSIANNQQRHGFINQGSVLHKLFASSKNLSPDERGKLLESNEDMLSAHKVSAKEGQSQPIDAKEEVDLHFVAIVNVDGKIYELDGVKPWPVFHGLCESQNDFVEEAAKVCKVFMKDIMKKDPSETRFSILALSEKQD